MQPNSEGFSEAINSMKIQTAVCPYILNLVFQNLRFLILLLYEPFERKKTTLDYACITF